MDKTRSFTSRTILGLVGIAAIAVLLLVQATLADMQPVAISQPVEKIDLSRPSVIEQMRALGRLETASFEIEKIVEAGVTGEGFLEEAFYKDRLLLIAHGEVVAGFDLANLKESDVVVDGKKITLFLGAPQILLSRLDNTETRVYAREVGTFSTPDTTLESRTRAQAEKAIRLSACQGNILGKAAKEAKEMLSHFLRLTEFDQVEVITKKGQCV